MTVAPITRRGLVAAGAAVLGAAALPAGISRALSAEAQSTTAAGDAVFDPAAFVADIRAAGFSITAMRDAPQPGWGAGRPTYCIGPGARTTFGRPYLAIMARWSDAMDACPDHVERVVAHIVEQARRL